MHALQPAESSTLTSDGDAILMAQKLATSSDANFLGAIEAQNRLGADAVVVTVFSDDNKKYLTTDRYKAVCDTACEFPGCAG